MSKRQDKKQIILKNCLENCIFDGWTKKLLENACVEAGFDKNLWKVEFPGGVVDVIDFYTSQANDNMTQGLDLEGLRTPEKIKALIKNRLSLYEDEKEQIRSCIAVYSLHAGRGLQAGYRTVDSIWRAAGDTATDWNFYSKRAILYGVYMSTLMFWLDDESKDHQEAWKFLDRRLGNVAEFGKFTGKVKKSFSFFNPAA